MKKAFLSILVVLVAIAYVAQSDATPEEELTSSPEFFESFIAMQKTQTKEKSSLAQELALPPFNRVFTVGSQRRSCFKSTKIRAGCKCPAVVRKGVWANRGRHKNASDIFKVTSSVHSTKLTVKRVDPPGRNCHGWGMNLQIICKCFRHNQWAPKREKATKLKREKGRKKAMLKAKGRKIAKSKFGSIIARIKAKIKAKKIRRYSRRRSVRRYKVSAYKAREIRAKYARRSRRRSVRRYSRRRSVRRYKVSQRPVKRRYWSRRRLRRMEDLLNRYGM